MKSGKTFRPNPVLSSLRCIENNNKEMCTKQKFVYFSIKITVLKKKPKETAKRRKKITINNKKI